MCVYANIPYTLRDCEVNAEKRMATNSSCSFLICGTIMKKLSFVQNGGSPNVGFLFLRCLAAIFLVGVLGFKDRQNGLYEVPILQNVICVCGIGLKTKPGDPNLDHLIKWNNKFDMLLHCFSWLHKKKCQFCIFKSADACANVWSLFWNVTLNYSVWVSK